MGRIDLTDSRFETNPASTFLAGEIMPSASLATKMLLRSHGPKSKSINFRTTSISTAKSQTRGNFAVTSRTTHHDGFVSTSYNELIGTKRPLVADLANVPTVKIGQYSKRNPDTLFYRQGEAPRSSDTEGHGGVYYSPANYGKLKYDNRQS